MAFKFRKYHAPDFKEKKFVDAPDCKMVEVDMEGTAPEGFHALSIYPEYFKVDGKWLLCEEARMDSVPVYMYGKILSVEPRRLMVGDKVVVGRTEDAEEGIYMHAHGFEDPDASSDTFAFRTGRSRETAFQKDIDEIVELLKHEKEHGKVVWTMGPVVSFASNARAAMAAIIDAGYCDALLAGNALATHDLEGAYLGTALGQNIYTQENVPNGHYNHLDTINAVTRAGGIKQFVEKYKIKDGIMAACTRQSVPFILAGSIRDDGPLPDVDKLTYESADHMRHEVKNATTIISMASMLHSIATGNLTPSFRVLPDGTIRETYFYIVDTSEFVINKCADRGSLSSKGIVTNVQDFITRVADGLGLKY
ncbi:MAG: hypothetical protein KBS56_02080 [Clostridiales bacterium]|nr:hypothetical protein [Candidatus Crickella equi]